VQLFSNDLRHRSRMSKPVEGSDHTDQMPIRLSPPPLPCRRLATAAQGEAEAARAGAGKETAAMLTRPPEQDWTLFGAVPPPLCSPPSCSISAANGGLRAPRMTRRAGRETAHDAGRDTEPERTLAETLRLSGRWQRHCA
jgi:hypothetical protein